LNRQLAAGLLGQMPGPAGGHLFFCVKVGLFAQIPVMKRVVVASTNPTKIQAVENGFQEMFPEGAFAVEGVKAPSGVPDQPIGDEETYRGAFNRLQAARQDHPTADFWVGIEGGNVETPHGMEVMAWVVVQSADRTGKARTAGFYLPPRVIELVHQGYELGHADDIVFGTSNSKQEMGSSGLLTHNVMTRVRFYRQAVILALIPFVQPELYPE
jgi:inosine/xanthosine triphosphatase